MASIVKVWENHGVHVKHTSGKVFTYGDICDIPKSVSKLLTGETRTYKSYRGYATETVTEYILKGE